MQENNTTTTSNGKSPPHPDAPDSNRFSEPEAATSTYNNGGPVFSDTDMADIDNSEWSKVTNS